MAQNSIRACPLRSHVDPRLPRYSAGATAVVLVASLLLVEVVRPVAIALLASQVAIFAFTAFVSFHWSIWAQLYARFVWPRLSPPTRLDDARPHRFAQAVGFVLSGAALVAFILDADAVGYVLAGIVLALAVLNAVTGLCLGCKLYRFGKRSRKT